MNQIIEDIYKTGQVLGRSGKVHKLRDSIDYQEGKFLFDIIQNDSGIKKTLEVGCAHGLSSLFICEAIRERVEASHTIIDPNQNTQYDGVGIKNLEKAGFNFFNFIEAKSEFALPQLLEKEEGQFDLVFVDGWHTFDHTLVDCFYASRLLRVGGYLVVDDVSFPSIKRVVDFLKNYPCYDEFVYIGGEISISWKKTLARSMMFPIPQRAWSKVLSPGLYRRIFDNKMTKMVALKKTKEDNRNWDWHIDTF